MTCNLNTPRYSWQNHQLFQTDMVFIVYWYILTNASCDLSRWWLIGCWTRTYLSTIILTPGVYLTINKAILKSGFYYLVSITISKNGKQNVLNDTQLRTSPSAVKASEWWLPQATWVTRFVCRLVHIKLGVEPWLVLPLPSWQYPLWPHVNNSPPASHENINDVN